MKNSSLFIFLDFVFSHEKDPSLSHEFLFSMEVINFPHMQSYFSCDENLVDMM